MDLSSTRIQTLFPFAKKILAQPAWFKLGGLVVLMLFCWMATCGFCLNRYHKIKNLSTEVKALLCRAEALQKQKALYTQMKEQNLRAPSDYIKKNVETLPLLQGERLRTAALAKQFSDNSSLKERLQFLEGDQNQIHFETLREEDNLKLSLSHRVQMDLSDLRKFLELVEGDRYDAAQEKPFLMMRKFDLLKCHEKGDEKVYSIHAELIQKL